MNVSSEIHIHMKRIKFKLGKGWKWCLQRGEGMGGEGRGGEADWLID